MRFKTTYGPRGRNIIIDQPPRSPLATNDGALIAGSLELSDKFENMGAHLVKAAAKRTKDIVGDGTTTATVLAQAMLHEGMKCIVGGANPVLLNKGISLGVEKAIRTLKENAKKVKTREEMEQVACIAQTEGGRCFQCRPRRA